MTKYILIVIRKKRENNDGVIIEFDSFYPKFYTNIYIEQYNHVLSFHIEINNRTSLPVLHAQVEQLFASITFPKGQAIGQTGPHLCTVKQRIFNLY